MAAGGPTYDYTIAGQVEWPGEHSRTTQNHIGLGDQIKEIAFGATVSLIDGTNTIATTFTKPDGKFNLQIGNFAPEVGKAYVLEALKGLGNQRLGNDASRLRTFITFAFGWKAIHTTGITLSPSSTALCVIQSAAAVLGKAGAIADPTKYIGLVTAKAKAGEAFDKLNVAAGVVGQAEYEEVHLMVEDAVSGREDPVSVITLKDGKYVLKLTRKPLIAGFHPDATFPGNPITIVGTNLHGATSVAIEGKRLEILESTETRILAILPGDAAAGTGSVIIKALLGESFPTEYRVLAPITGKYNPDNN